MKERPKTGAVYGALAFDLRVTSPVRRRLLETAEAYALARHLRRNLTAECAEIGALHLSLAPAFYDPCARLRPGWPLHRRLRALRTSCQDSEGHKTDRFIHLIDREHLPEPRGFDVGRELLSLPFMLDGPADDAREAARRLDENRMRPYTPRVRDPAFQWPAMPAFDAVGFLSLRSLSAEIGARYYSEGLGDAWALIDCILRAPNSEHVMGTRTAIGLPCKLHYVDGCVRLDGGDEASNSACRRLLAAHGIAMECTNSITPAEGGMPT